MSDAPKDKFNITIRLAELPPIPLQIKREDEPIVRTAEYNVNQLWKSWVQRFSDKSAYEVLAMVAFQFAKAYVTLNNQAERTTAVINDFERTLDRLLLATGPEAGNEEATNDADTAYGKFAD